MVFCDPPYSVSYTGKTARKLTIKNDDLGAGFYEFLRDACANHVGGYEGSHLHLHVLIGTAHAIQGVHGSRRPLVDVYHLGEEPLHARKI